MLSTVVLWDEPIYEVLIIAVRLNWNERSTEFLHTLTRDHYDGVYTRARARAHTHNFTEKYIICKNIMNSLIMMMLIISRIRIITAFVN